MDAAKQVSAAAGVKPIPLSLGEPRICERPDGSVAVTACRSCGATTEVFLDHGNLPGSNQLMLTPDEVVPTYPIAYGFCRACYLVQIQEPVPPEVLFTDEYAFITSSSQHMVDHYASLAGTLRERWKPRSVVEVGPNDGVLLQHFRDLTHVGYEPSANVAQMARDKGLSIVERFFGYANMTPEFRENVMPIDLVLACHVATHLPDQNDFFAGVAVLLAPKGVLVTEDPSLLDVMRSGAADQFYEEHTAVHSLWALVTHAERHGLQVIDAEPQPVHGGSLRVTFARQGAYVPHVRVTERLEEEDSLTQWETYRDFGRETAERFDLFHTVLKTLKHDGKRIAGYGLTSKSSVPIIRCGLGPDTIEYIVDSTPTKQGKFAPGSGIPVISRAQADVVGLPDVFVLFAWNHKTEILAKEAGKFTGQWVEYVPDVRVFVA